MEVPQLFDMYGMAHIASYKKSKALSESDLATPSTFTNTAYSKLKAYTEVAKEKHGKAYNPLALLGERLLVAPLFGLSVAPPTRYC